MNGKRVLKYVGQIAAHLNGEKTVQSMENGRDTKGRFAAGSKGGPGRPRRAVERDYLVKSSDCISLDDWGQIVKKAVQNAKKGDARAREFVARFVIGNPGTLQELAAKEAAGLTVQRELVNEAHLFRAYHLKTMGLRMKTALPDALEAVFPIEVGDLDDVPTSGFANGKPKQQSRNEFDYVI